MRPTSRVYVPPLAVSRRTVRPMGPVRGGVVRPLRVVPGAEHPWVRMAGDPSIEKPRFAREELEHGQVARAVERSGELVPWGRRAPWVGPPGSTHLGAIGAEEIERGQLIVDQAGQAIVLPDTSVPNARAPWYINLRPSGSRGVPITVGRTLRVKPQPGAMPLGAVDQPPSTDLTRVWPQLFPPGREAGERARAVASASVTVGAGATVTLIALPELARGIAAVIKKFGQTSNDFTNLVWSFMVKGATVEPISGITYQFGALNLPTDLPGSGVMLNPGDDFVVSVTNTGGAAVSNVRARVDLYEYRAS